MTEQKVWVGTAGPFLYDDTDDIDDPDVPAGPFHALTTTHQLRVLEPATDPEHLVRVDDFLTLLPQPLGPTDSPTFAGLTLTTPLPIASGGTASSTSSAARTALGFNTGAADKVALWSSGNAFTYDAALHYDSTNNYLGIGQSSPAALLDTLNGNVKFVRNDATDLVLDLDTSTVENRIIQFKTNGLTRWGIRALDDAESGSDVGSSFELRGYDDSGALIGRAMTVQRATLRTGFGTTTAQTRVHLTSDSVASGALTVSSSRAAIVATNVLGGVDVWSNDTSLTAPGQIAAYVRALATQTHNASALGTQLDFATTPNGTTTPVVRATIGEDGRFYQKTPNSAPTDANIGTSKITLWVNETLHQLMVRAKYSDGTLKSGIVALA